MSRMIAQPTQVALMAYAQKGKDAALEAPASLQLALFSARAFNRSGGAINVGICRKFDPTSLSLFSAIDPDPMAPTAPVFEEITLPIDSAVPIVGQTIGDGFYVGAKSRFGLIGMNVSQQGAGGVYTFKYWDGEDWQTLTTLETTDFTATGEKYITFLPPHNWEKGGDDLDSAHYYIQVVNSTAPAADIEIDEIWAATMLEFVEGIADNSGVSIEFENEHPLILQAGEAIMPYFSSANAANGIRLAYTNT